MNNKSIVNTAQIWVPHSMAGNLLSCFRKWNMLTTKTILGENTINMSERLLAMQPGLALPWVTEESRVCIAILQPRIRASVSSSTSWTELCRTVNIPPAVWASAGGWAASGVRIHTHKAALLNPSHFRPTNTHLWVSDSLVCFKKIILIIIVIIVVNFETKLLHSPGWPWTFCSLPQLSIVLRSQTWATTLTFFFCFWDRVPLDSQAGLKLKIFLPLPWKY